MARKPKKTQTAPPAAKMRPAASSKSPPTDALPWPFVEVHWSDATSESNWRAQNDLPQVTGIITRGWLVRTTKVCVTIAASLASMRADPGMEVAALDCGEIITIPRGCIVEIIGLSISRAHKKKVTLN
jgi:hypothetical protein